MNKILSAQQFFGQGDGGDFVGGNSFSWGKVLNVKNAPWYSQVIMEAVESTTMADITELGNSYEQTALQMAVTKENHILLFYEPKLRESALRHLTNTRKQ